jgi:hypothetical protein
LREEAGQRTPLTAESPKVSSGKVRRIMSMSRYIMETRIVIQVTSAYEHNVTAVGTGLPLAHIAALASLARCPAAQSGLRRLVTVTAHIGLDATPQRSDSAPNALHAT